MAKKLLIGGYTLEKLRSTRRSHDLAYLIKDESTNVMYVHDKAQNTVCYNANRHAFFWEVWQMEKNNIDEIASLQALLELRAFVFVQHKQNGV